MKNKRKGGLFVMILSCLLTISLTTSCDKKYVTYEEYGAVGDSCPCQRWQDILYRKKR